MTIKLYEQNVYLAQCTSQVLDIIEKDGDKLIILDQTIFSPKGGGQPGDKGTIDGCLIKSVYEENGVIYHSSDKAPSSKEVLCKIDWNHRLDMMQNHCGEHILSGIFFREYGAANKGFHMGQDYITIDLDMPSMSKEVLQKVEALANDAIYANIPVSITLLKNNTEAASYSLRKPLNVEEDIKIVSIDGIDCVACCGTHPSRTGDVGIIKILKSENYKGMTRIYFKCGQRALTDYQNKQDIVMQLFNHYSANESNLIEKITIEESKNQQLRKDLIETKNIITDYEAESILHSNDKIVVKAYSNYSIEDLKHIIKKVLEKESKVLILSAISSNAVIIALAGAFEIHCGNLIKEYAFALGGKGGGSDKMGQAVFENKEDMDIFIKTVIEKINDKI